MTELRPPVFSSFELLVYLDRESRWRTRVDLTLPNGKPFRFYVPKRTSPGVERGHGLVPLLLQVDAAVKELGSLLTSGYVAESWSGADR